MHTILRYPGQYADEETGLCYNRFRYYDPAEGVYLSQDPIGLAGGNPTLYGYVRDVNGEVDVFGLAFSHSASNPKELHASIRDKWGYDMAPNEMREVQNAADRIKLRDRSAYPSKDGTMFQNSHQVSPDAQRLNTAEIYEEWTVKTPGVGGRGARRIVVSKSSNRAYYTQSL